VSDFIVIPAIDIRNGKCVRLRRGKIAEEKIYSDNPVEMALRWANEGAKLLHVVDLDGAFAGRPVNFELVLKIAAAVKIPVQTGGGLRTAGQIEKILEGGVKRAVIGTSACRSDWEAEALIKKFGEKLAIGIDARNGLAQTKGWTATTSINAVDLAVKLAKLGAKTLIFTDTGRDGTLAGPNVPEIEKFCRAVDCDVIASGGVSGPEDIARLQALKLPNLRGVIVGKALYEGKFSLKDICSNKKTR